MTYDEFFFLCNQQTWQINEGLMHDIKVAYLKKDDLTLKAVREKMETMNQNSKIVHLQWLCDALINRLKSIHVSSSENKLVHYLLEIEEWTRYEIVLFNNSIFSFDIDIVNILVQKIIKKNYSYNLYKNNNRELFQLLINVTACNIQNSDFKKAKRIFNSAKELFLEEDALFEKNILLFWTGFFEAYNGEVEGKAKIKESLNIFHLLNSTNLFRMHKDLYDSFFIFE
uniref:HTH-type transcriptional regulator Rgg C-terminal domain-containing protein n=1 Tax=Candidatus Enterococcus mansonii TaxID=1834181 RepID=A0A242CEY1_9ENTE|nr:hypothetical protein A5880_001814 [Enterococcus sp. 4G2_DIV0659]